MTVYKRPNLTPSQSDLVASLLRQHLSGLDVDSPAFDETYRALIKVRDCRIIKAGR